MLTLISSYLFPLHCPLSHLFDRFQNHLPDVFLLLPRGLPHLPLHLIYLLVPDLLRRREPLQHAFELTGLLFHHLTRIQLGYLLFDDLFNEPALLTDVLPTLLG